MTSTKKAEITAISVNIAAQAVAAMQRDIKDFEIFGVGYQYPENEGPGFGLPFSYALADTRKERMRQITSALSGDFAEWVFKRESTDWLVQAAIRDAGYFAASDLDDSTRVKQIREEAVAGLDEVFEMFASPRRVEEVWKLAQFVDLGLTMEFSHASRIIQRKVRVPMWFRRLDWNQLGRTNEFAALIRRKNAV